MWLLLHGGGTRPCRHLQRHPHHLLAKTGRTLLLGLCQHLAPQGLPAPMKAELGKEEEEEEEEEEEGLEERYFQGYDGIVSGTVLWM